MQFCINTIRNKTDIDAISFSSAQKVAIICFKKEKNVLNISVPYK